MVGLRDYVAAGFHWGKFPLGQQSVQKIKIPTKKISEELLPQRCILRSYHLQIGRITPSIYTRSPPTDHSVQTPNWTRSPACPHATTGSVTHRKLPLCDTDPQTPDHCSTVLPLFTQFKQDFPALANLDNAWLTSSGAPKKTMTTTNQPASSTEPDSGSRAWS